MLITRRPVLTSRMPVAMGLGAPATLLLVPVNESDKVHAFAVEMQPGDAYLISGASRWDWRHGISVDSELARHNARRAVVWRFIEGDLESTHQDNERSRPGDEQMST